MARTKQIQLLRNKTLVGSLQELLEKWEKPEFLTNSGLLDGEQIIGRYGSEDKPHTIYGIAHIGNGATNSYIEVFYNKTELENYVKTQITNSEKGVIDITSAKSDSIITTLGGTSSGSGFKGNVTITSEIDFGTVTTDNTTKAVNGAAVVNAIPLIGVEDNATNTGFITGIAKTDKNVTATRRGLKINGQQATKLEDEENLGVTLDGSHIKLTGYEAVTAGNVEADDTINVAFSKISNKLSNGVVSSVQGANGTYISLTPNSATGGAVIITPELTFGNFTKNANGIAKVEDINTTFKVKDFNTKTNIDAISEPQTNGVQFVHSAELSNGMLTAKTVTLKAGNNISLVSGDAGEITISGTDTTYTAGNGLNLQDNKFSVKLKTKSSSEAKDINILTLDGETDGQKELFANAYIEKLAEIGTNSLAEYQLKSGNSVLGEKIIIPKDSTLKEVYVGHYDDQIDKESGKVTKVQTGDSSLNFVHFLSDEQGVFTYSLTKIKVSDFATEALYGDGLKVYNNVVSVDLTENGGLQINNPGQGGTVGVKTLAENPVKVKTSGEVIYEITENTDTEYASTKYVSKVTQDAKGAITVTHADLPKRKTITTTDTIAVTGGAESETSTSLDVKLSDKSLISDSNGIKLNTKDGSIVTSETNGVSVGIVDCGTY